MEGHWPVPTLLTPPMHLSSTWEPPSWTLPGLASSGFKIELSVKSVTSKPLRESELLTKTDTTNCTLGLGPGPGKVGDVARQTSFPLNDEVLGCLKYMSWEELGSWLLSFPAAT